MRRYIATCVALTFLLFVAAAMAQTTPGSSSQYPSQPGASGSQSPSSSPSSQQPDSSASGQMGQSGNSADQGASKQKERSVEGCIAKEESDYFLVPHHGNPILLQSSGSENPSSHVGHRVKVRGNETAASSAGSGAGTTGGSAGAAESNPSAGMSKPESSGSVSSQAGSAGASSGGSASSSGGQLHQMAKREITVDKIDMVSESCPANWNSSVPTSSGASGTSNPPNGSSNPPKR